MQEQFVSYEQALALKEIDFDEPCLGLYHGDGMFSFQQTYSHNQYYGQVCSAPLKQKVFDWFIEKYNLEGVVQKNDKYQWYMYDIFLLSDNDAKICKEFSRVDYKNKPQATTACIDRLIEIGKRINKK